MRKGMSLLEEQAEYLLEEGNEGESSADTSTADSGENRMYAKSLKALQESKKRLLKAEDESLDGDTSKKIKSALGAVDSAIEAIQQEMDGDDEDLNEEDDDNDEDDKPKEEGKGKKGKRRLQQNEDGDDKPKGEDGDKPKEEGKGKRRLQKNEDGDDEPTFGGSEDDLNEEDDDEDDEDLNEDLNEEGKGKKKK